MDEMNELLKKMAEITKKVVKGIGKILLIPMLIVILIVVILSGCVYFITVDDGTYKEDDWSSTPYVAGTYTSSVQVASDGSVTTTQTSKELWEKMEKEGGRANLYLDDSNELAKLMNAEIVTQYPDTRSNPDEEINWDDVDLEKNELQGIIKFKRADKDGNIFTLKYVDPSTFQGYIDDYNATGNEQSKKNALSHFTIGSTTRAGSSAIVTNGDGMCWPVDSSYSITSYFGVREAPVAGASTDHGAVDIGCPMDSSVYATQSGTVEIAGWNDSAGNWVVINHGNGFVTTYMHNSQVLVSAGQFVTKGQEIAKSGSTGVSTGPHCHFQIEENGVKLNPLDFKYDNPPNGHTCGNQIIPESSNSTASPDTATSDTATSNTAMSNSNKTTITNYVKVATWSQIDTTITTNDPNVTQSSNTKYSMTTTQINYLELVDKYTMPFDLLWALLVIGESKDFVMELADLAYNSEIEITVYDNYKKNTDIDKWTYTKQERVKGSGTLVDIEYKNTATVQPFEELTNKDYTTTKTVITQTNTLQVGLTKADTWIVEYTRGYEYKDKLPESTPSEQTKDDTEWERTEDQPNLNTYAHAHITLAENEIKQKVKDANYDEEKINVVRYLDLKKESNYINIKNNTTHTVESSNYQASTPSVKEKTDPQTNVDPSAVKPNFVTIYNKGEYSTNRSNIGSSESWLFEILEINESTANMVDMVKYLLYKATGNSYGITEFDFNIYDASKFQSISGISGTSLLSEFLKCWENGTVRDYIIGNADYSVASSYITEDKQKYIMFDDGYNTMNYGFGVCISRNGGGTWYHVDKFEELGIDITDSQYHIEGVSMLPVEIVDKVKESCSEDKRKEVENIANTVGVTLESYQIDALISCRYQGHSITSFLEAYKQYGINESIRVNCGGMRIGR